MKDGQVAADDDTGAAEFAQDAGHHFVVAGQLVVQPDVLDRQAQLLKQVENQLQFRIDQRFARDAAVKDGHAHQGFPVQNGHGNLRAEQFKFLLCLDVGAGFLAVAAQNAARAEKMAADAGFEGQSNVRAVRGTSRWRRQCAGGGFRRQVAAPPKGRGLAQENRRAVDAENFAQEQQELLSIPSAFNEWVRMAEKSRSTLRVMGRIGEDCLPQHLGILEMPDGWGGGGVCQTTGVAQRRSRSVVSMRMRTGLVSTCVTSLQIGFLFPFGLFGAGVNDDGAFRVAAAQFLQNPQPLNAGQFDIQNAGIEQVRGPATARLLQARFDARCGIAPD